MEMMYVINILTGSYDLISPRLNISYFSTYITFLNVHENFNLDLHNLNRLVIRNHHLHKIVLLILKL